MMLHYHINFHNEKSQNIIIVYQFGIFYLKLMELHIYRIKLWALQYDNISEIL